MAENKSWKEMQEHEKINKLATSLQRADAEIQKADDAVKGDEKEIIELKAKKSKISSEQARKLLELRTQANHTHDVHPGNGKKDGKEGEVKEMKFDFTGAQRKLEQEINQERRDLDQEINKIIAKRSMDLTTSRRVHAEHDRYAEEDKKERHDLERLLAEKRRANNEHAEGLH